MDSVESALAAERGGARRLELCDALFDGGTTPSAGMIAACRDRVAIPLFVIIRPRGGGFVYSEPELDVMRWNCTLDHESANEQPCDRVTPVSLAIHADCSRVVW